MSIQENKKERGKLDMTENNDQMLRKQFESKSTEELQYQTEIYLKNIKDPIIIPNSDKVLVSFHTKGTMTDLSLPKVNGRLTINSEGIYVDVKLTFKGHLKTDEKYRIPWGELREVDTKRLKEGVLKANFRKFSNGEVWFLKIPRIKQNINEIKAFEQALNELPKEIKNPGCYKCGGLVDDNNICAKCGFNQTETIKKAGLGNLLGGLLGVALLIGGFIFIGITKYQPGILFKLGIVIIAMGSFKAIWSGFKTMISGRKKST
ncbi:MAG: hypothetical protein JRJ38_07130 [Deltaproteobacteria bacterium]|nr:hypothetical protein [Deltaproteobacteria bacterium]